MKDSGSKITPKTDCVMLRDCKKQNAFISDSKASVSMLNTNGENLYKEHAAWLRFVKSHLDTPQDFNKVKSCAQLEQFPLDRLEKVEMFGTTFGKIQTQHISTNTTFCQSRWLSGDDLGLFCSYRTRTPCRY